MKIFMLTGLILLFSRDIKAQELFHCTHVQVCNLARFLTIDNTEFKLIKGLEGLNPHHSSPSVAVYKDLKKSDGVLFAPLEIEPWFKGYENKSAKSYRLKLEAKYSHFWLHPNSLCEAEKQLRSHLMTFSLKLKDPNQGFCKDVLKKAKTKKFVVLTHESLLPLVEDMGLEYFIINTHDEHHDVSPKTLKDLTRKIKEQASIMWIIETQFHHPQAIRNMIKKEHSLLEINTIGLNREAPDQVLKRIISFMEGE